jgi:hypothetical protein
MGVPFNVTCRVVRICGTISAAPAGSVRAASSPPMELAMPHSKEARPKSATPHKQTAAAVVIAQLAAHRQAHRKETP